MDIGSDETHKKYKTKIKPGEKQTGTGDLQMESDVLSVISMNSSTKSRSLPQNRPLACLFRRATRLQRSSSLKPARKLFCKFTLDVSSLLQEPKGLWMLRGTSCTYLLPLQSRNCAGFVQFEDVRQQTDRDPTAGSTDQLGSVSLSSAALFFPPKQCHCIRSYQSASCSGGIR